MRTILATVADDRSGRKGGRYVETQANIKTLFQNNPHFGINEFRMWDWNDITKTSFYSSAKIQEYKLEVDVINPLSGCVILSAGTVIPKQLLLDYIEPANNGRVYKPLLVYETLKELNDGDFLIYSDCSPEMWNMGVNYKINPTEFKLDVIKRLCMQNGGILTAHVKWNYRTHVEKGEVGYHTHENFTTDKCIEVMGMQQYKYSLQHASGMIVLQKSKRSMEFAEEWLYWNSNEYCGGLGPRQDPLFWFNEVNNNFKIGHRHDQSVSGLLINKMGNKIIETLDWYERPQGRSPYWFLNFCKPEWNYNFFDSNQPMGPIRHKMICPDGDVGSHEKWTIEVTQR